MAASGALGYTVGTWLNENDTVSGTAAIMMEDIMRDGLFGAAGKGFDRFLDFLGDYKLPDYITNGQ